MYRYIRNKTTLPASKALCIHDNRCLYLPIVLHVTIGQDRPIGDTNTFREHRHNLYHIVLYTAGHGAFLVDQQAYSAEAGNVCITSPGQPHDFVSQFRNVTYSELTFAFENDQRQPLMMPFDRLLGKWAGTRIKIQNPLRLSEAECRQLDTLLTEIADVASSEHEISDFNLQYALIKLFHFLMQGCFSPSSSSMIVDERLMRVRNYIAQRYNTPIRIDDLAALANLSKGYLFRAFSKAFGITPLSYQKQLRLEAAKTLLRSTPLRCSEIAQRCGYNNNHFFHRMFKKTLGATPTEYRKGVCFSNTCRTGCTCQAAEGPLE